MRAAAVYALGTLDSSQESSTKLISSKLSQAEVPQQGCAGGDQGEYRAAAHDSTVTDLQPDGGSGGGAGKEEAGDGQA